MYVITLNESDRRTAVGHDVTISPSVLLIIWRTSVFDMSIAASQSTVI